MAMKNEDKDDRKDGSVGDAVRRWRKARGLLQKQLATAAGMEVAQLWAVESNRNSPSVRTLSRIAAALRISTVELLSPPPEDGAAPSARQKKDAPTHLEKREAIPILRPANKERVLMKRDEQRMEKAIALAARAEAAQQADIPTSLPFSFPIVVNEGGAEQLAHFLRAHLDIGSAIVRDAITLFENHGVRILQDDSLSGGNPAVTFYSRVRRDFTVFLAPPRRDGDGAEAGGKEEKPWRREFAFLTEIGFAFVFASKKFETFTETDKSRRFAHHFAATFLMPASAVRMAVYSLRVDPGEWTFELLLRLKARFGVSAQAFNIRLRELGLITLAKSAEFDAEIKARYGADFSEPMPDGAIPPNRAGDLLALGRMAEGGQSLAKSGVLK